MEVELQFFTTEEFQLINVEEMRKYKISRTPHGSKQDSPIDAKMSRWKFK